MYGTSEKSSHLGKIPVLRMGNINREGGLDWKDLVYSNNEEDIEKFNLLHNDLLFNRTNSSEWVGKTAIYKGERPAIYAGYIIRLRTIFVNADYINFVMNSQYHRNWCNDVKTDAVNQSNINAQKLSVFRVPLPPIEEQKRIVKEIKRWLSLIKVIKSGKENLQESIKQTKSKVLDLAIHGKLVPQDPNEEPAIELLKRINPKAEIITDNGHYQKLPVGWCVCHINEISESLLGKTLDRTKDSGEFKRYVCAVNVQWGYFDFTTQKEFRIEAKDFERYAVKKGDLLICEGGDVGRCAIWDTDTEMYYQNALHRVRCKFGISEKYLQYSLWHFKLNGVIDSLCKGVTIKHFTQSTMNKLEIPLPPFAEQQRIVAKIEELFHQLNMIEESL